MLGSEPEVLIDIQDLWKRYGKHEVLKGLNLQIYKGETLVILGRSGVGKSVLLRQIIGIEKPDKGAVLIEGKNIATLPGAKRDRMLRRMGMLFQGAALFDSLTVGQNVGFYLTQNPDPLTGKWVDKNALKERVGEALSTVGLVEVGDKMPSELSGGMRKRAGLARLVLYRPEILLYDEPTTGLDPVTAMQINNMINSIQAKLKATSIVVTHDIKSALSVGDRFAFHHEGKILFVGNREQFLSSKDPLVQAFLHEAALTEEQLTR
jgi:phospholipid/cholesterol/gamma-HCH transport system ATP-binding protein